MAGHRALPESGTSRGSAGTQGTQSRKGAIGPVDLHSVVEVDTAAEALAIDLSDPYHVLASRTVSPHSILMQPEQSNDFQTTWIAECAHRLRLRWPRLQVETLEEVACELLSDDELRGLGPVEAAESWLARGA